jgi:membrane protease YdiL (CAAX protease family)
MPNQPFTAPDRTSTSHQYFFQGVDLKPLLGVSLCLGLVATVVNTISELHFQPAHGFSMREFLRQFSLYSSCCLLGSIFADKIRIQHFLIRREGSWTKKSLLLLLFGVFPGVSIGITYHHLFAPYRFNPLVPFWIRQLGSHYDTFLLSLRASVTEELVFRFLLLTAFLYILKKAFHPLIEQGFGLTQWIPVLFSVLFSSLLFGVVHGAYGFMTAFLAGIALCLSFFRGGLESVILAHFLADFLFFNWTYL